MIADVSILGVFGAALAMFFVGFVFYGLLFSKYWQAARELTDEQLAKQSPIWMVGGFLIELMAAIGIGWLITKIGIESPMAALSFGALLGTFIGLSMRSYEFVYSVYHSLPGALVDWGSCDCDVFRRCPRIFSNRLTKLRSDDCAGAKLIDLHLLFTALKLRCF